MPVYKDAKGNWYVKIRYIDWTGKKNKQQKEDLKHKKMQKDMKLNFYQ